MIEYPFSFSLLSVFIFYTFYYIYILMLTPIHKIFFLDIDDTLLTANNIFIYFKKNLSKNKILKLTPNEYKKYALKYPKEHFNFSDFDNPNIINDSIMKAEPLLHNLEIVKEHIRDGWDLGILTARGEEETIKKILPIWLRNQLQMNFNLEQENIYAVGDRIIKYPGENDSDRKLKVLIEYWKVSKYNKIKLIDDNKNTIDLIKSFKHFKFEYIHC